MSRWDPSSPGVLVLPSGRALRGRALRGPRPGPPLPEFGVYLLRRPPTPSPWPTRWVRWPDFGVPSDRQDAREALVELWEKSAHSRTEVACDGGRGRTGTALACLAVLDGIPGREAVAFVREHYDLRAVETPGQRRYVARFVGR